MSTQIIRCTALLLCTMLFSTGVSAQGFSVLVSPPRFEDTAKPGARYRNVIEISNVSAQSTHLNLKTADWELGADGGAKFSDALSPGSCRPWVGIEASEITIAANGKRRYRFEVAVPSDAPSGECRFAILIEGDPAEVKSGVALPVAGRIGVIVYLTIGDASAKLEFAGKKILSVEGRDLPAVGIRNTGNAHARMEGFIEGTDASGRRFSFLPSNLPILANETRDIVLTPQGDNDETPAPAIVYPLSLKGRIDSGSQRVDIETTFSR
ncbi:MAG: hypothetical protein ABWX88_00210 [Pseudoxanthomonas sp.]